MIGIRIKDRRKILALTQKDLATQVGVTQAAVSKWELNTDEPKGKYLEDLSRTLKVTVIWLLHGDPIVQQSPKINGLSSNARPAIQLYDRISASKLLSDLPCDPVGAILDAPIPIKLLSRGVFALLEDRDGLSPAINKGDYVFISEGGCIQSGSYSMFWVNGVPIIGKIEVYPTSMTLKFHADAPDWEPIKVEDKDYIGRVIHIDHLWIRQAIGD